jgi:hypothetical protein
MTEPPAGRPAADTVSRGSAAKKQITRAAIAGWPSGMNTPIA